MKSQVNTRQKEATFCEYCGGKLDSWYFFTCHSCGESYCYAHMQRHKAHDSKVSQPPVVEAH